MIENLDNNCSIPARYLRKKRDPPTPTLAKAKTELGHTGEGVTRHLKAPAGGVRKDQVGSWGFHPSQAGISSLPQQYQERPHGEPGLSPPPSSNEASLPLPDGVISKEAQGRSGFSLLPGSNEATHL